MDELLTAMIAKAQIDVDGSLRQHVSALNGIAALNVINEDWETAAEHYRLVLTAAKDYENTNVKVDTLQVYF
jgi:hypothetical protein